MHMVLYQSHNTHTRSLARLATEEGVVYIDPDDIGGTDGVHPFEVVVETTVREANSRMLTFEYHLKRIGDGALLAKGYTKHVFLDKNLERRRLPSKYHLAFEIS